MRYDADPLRRDRSGHGDARRHMVTTSAAQDRGTATHRAADRRSPRLAALLRGIAEKQEADADRIAATMVATYSAEIPAYGRITEPALRSDIQAVSAAVVRIWLAFIADPDSLTPDMMIPLRQGARRRAAQGFDLHSMLRAYRVGIRVMWRELVSAPEWRRSAPLRNAALEIGEWTLDFADRITTEAAGAYVDEAAQVAREREHRRSAMLNVILAGPGAEPVQGPAQLERPHVVVVADISGDLRLEQLEQIGVRLESLVDAALWTVRHHSVIAAVPLTEDCDRRARMHVLAGMLPQAGIVAFGVGGEAQSARDTGQSYREAVEALRVGRLLDGAGRPVYDYQGFAPVISLLQHPGQARRFVATALRPLTPVIDRPWALPTLEAYIERQGRMKEVALALGVHLNTVKYRLHEIREAVGAAAVDGEQSASLLLALRLRRAVEASDG
jgi:PucR-like helix-turn-helix protein/diguanylate cyclase with GGDEF domain